MRFLITHIPGSPETYSGCKSDDAAMQELTQKLRQDGVLLQGFSLLPAEHRARIGLSAGRMTVLDGPFVETKEFLAGIVVIEAASKAEAIAVSEKLLRVLGQGQCDILEVASNSPV